MTVVVIGGSIVGLVASIKSLRKRFQTKISPRISNSDSEKIYLRPNRKYETMTPGPHGDVPKKSSIPGESFFTKLV